MKAMLEVRRPMGKGKFEIGLAWAIFGDFVWHDGGTGGFRSFVGCDQKARTGVVVLSNSSTLPGVDDIAIHLLNPNMPLANLEPPEVQRSTPGFIWIPNSSITTRDVTNCRTDFSKSPATATGFSFRASHREVVGGPKFEMFAESEKNFIVKQTGSNVHF